jgi:hypothetical protein
MARARYEPSNPGMKAIRMSADLSKAAMAAGTDVVLVALTLSPDAKPGEKGASDGTSYREHFEVSPIVVDIGRGPRQSARVENDADYAAQVEFGTGPGWKGDRVQGGNPGRPHRVLGRAGQQVGEYKGGPPK